MVGTITFGLFEAGLCFVPWASLKTGMPLRLNSAECEKIVSPSESGGEHARTPDRFARFGNAGSREAFGVRASLAPLFRPTSQKLLTFRHGPFPSLCLI